MFRLFRYALSLEDTWLPILPIVFKCHYLIQVIFVDKLHWFAFVTLNRIWSDTILSRFTDRCFDDCLYRVILNDPLLPFFQNFLRYWLRPPPVRVDLLILNSDLFHIFGRYLGCAILDSKLFFWNVKVGLLSTLPTFIKLTQFRNQFINHRYSFSKYW